MSKPVIEKIQSPLGNRDGIIWIVRDCDNQCWLVAEADTYHNTEFFQGMGSTEQTEISRESFDALFQDFSR